MMRNLVLALLLIAGPALADLPPEAQGHADRTSYEEWFGRLSGNQRAGAEFWADQRSKPQPISCLGTDRASQPDFVTGCQEAQRRLALPDVRRKTEPGYRSGWNANLEAQPALASKAPSLDQTNCRDVTVSGAIAGNQEYLDALEHSNLAEMTYRRPLSCGVQGAGFRVHTPCRGVGEIPPSEATVWFRGGSWVVVLVDVHFSDGVWPSLVYVRPAQLSCR